MVMAEGILHSGTKVASLLGGELCSERIQLKLSTCTIAGFSSAREPKRDLNSRQCHRHCTTTFRKQLYSPIWFCSPGVAAPGPASPSCCWCCPVCWASLVSCAGTGLVWVRDACMAASNFNLSNGWPFLQEWLVVKARSWWCCPT